MKIHKITLIVFAIMTSIALSHENVGDTAKDKIIGKWFYDVDKSKNFIVTHAKIKKDKLRSFLNLGKGTTMEFTKDNVVIITSVKRVVAGVTFPPKTEKYSYEILEASDKTVFIVMGKKQKFKQFMTLVFSSDDVIWEYSGGENAQNLNIRSFYTRFKTSSVAKIVRP